jgi:hypothetical protein
MRIQAVARLKEAAGVLDVKQKQKIQSGLAQISEGMAIIRVGLNTLKPIVDVLKKNDGSSYVDHASVTNSLKDFEFVFKALKDAIKDDDKGI